MDPAVKDRIDELIKANRVMLFMKGTPQMPQCGFSAQVVNILGQLQTDFESLDVLADPEVRQGIKEYSDWPTVPQLYIDGEFIGGCDIVAEMYQSGEIQKTLAPSA